MKQKFTTAKFFILFPAIGVVLFMILYFIATLLYPGGSAVDANYPGFSWADNYWCNLLNEYAINGEINTARPVAIIAMFLLAATMLIFWLLIFLHTISGPVVRKVLLYSSILCILFLIALNTGNHDIIISISSFFGLIATVCTLIVLRRKTWNTAFAWGIFNIFLVAVNNYVYYSSSLLNALPVVQKISFASFLCWMIYVDLIIYRHAAKRRE